MNDDKIRELEDEIETLKRDNSKQQKDFDARLVEMERVLRLHEHTGKDGSSALRQDIDLLPGKAFTVAETAAFGGIAEKTTTTERTLAILATGNDQNAKDGIGNSQVYIEHQQNTDGTTNQTFFQGIRAPIFTGSDGFTNTGGSTLSQKTYSWTEDELAGTFVVVTSAAAFQCALISSNTSDTLTIVDSWDTGGVGLTYTVFVPVYLGSATFPWRRGYVMDTTAGGIRFGTGITGSGNNGLLYMDGDALMWRRASGTAVRVDV